MTTDCSIDILNQIEKRVPDPFFIDNIVPIEIEIPFELKSSDFLNFAHSDLEFSDEHHLINSLSNCKRAIECQIDALLFSLGLFEKSKKKGWNFHKKTEILNDVGILSPRILKKINKERNSLEHDYLKPDPEKVEDAVDVAKLFLNYTDRYLKAAITSFCFFIDDNNPVEVNLDYVHGKIIFSTFPEDHDTYVIDSKVIKEISANSDEFFPYLTWFFSIVKKVNNC